MCRSQRNLAPRSSERTQLPARPKAGKERKKTSRVNNRSTETRGRVAQTVPSVPTPKPQPQPVADTPRGESVDTWARDRVRELAKSQNLGIAKGEVRRIARSVMDVVGERAVISEIQGRALEIIKQGVNAVKEAREQAAAAARQVVRDRQKPIGGGVHHSNRGTPKVVVETRRGGKILKGKGPQQHRTHHGKPVAADTSVENKLTDEEIGRRKKALLAAKAAEKKSD